MKRRTKKIIFITSMLITSIGLYVTAGKHLHQRLNHCHQSRINQERSNSSCHHDTWFSKHKTNQSPISEENKTTK